MFLNILSCTRFSRALSPNLCHIMVHREDPVFALESEEAQESHPPLGALPRSWFPEGILGPASLTSRGIASAVSQVGWRLALHTVVWSSASTGHCQTFNFCQAGGFDMITCLISHFLVSGASRIFLQLLVVWVYSLAAYVSFTQFSYCFAEVHTLDPVSLWFCVAALLAWPVITFLIKKAFWYLNIRPCFLQLGFVTVILVF